MVGLEWSHVEGHVEDQIEAIPPEQSQTLARGASERTMAAAPFKKALQACKISAASADEQNFSVRGSGCLQCLARLENG